ncbi:MAG: dihydroorotate dehydrogenase electron transfer subunit [Deltaproteobacteria bacterium]|nr:dihydroorotate dehydrogenase electron transfer subunit [Deltaproteobacteria bacterium]MBW2041922.1 dihydroorotate dehydrogenase electron transfer subunit [Deltaproteobacteria bacterium]MBW2132830.1 dihydroorotate dehydrogenase electron transfer subunit [Deltaproteobacteria bacterium]
MNVEQATVLKNERLTPAHYRMTLACHPSYQEAVPGQFVMLHVSGRDAPLLPRPFSIHRFLGLPGGEAAVQVLYRVVGPGTRKMARTREGERVQMVGPLGRGFMLAGAGSRPMVVAGGMGVAPMVFLVEAMLEKGMDPKDCRVFLGARGREELLCRDELIDAGVMLQVTTDDGSDGEHCPVTHPFQTAARADPPERIYACGPEAMLRCVAQAARVLKTPCQVSIETLMACGIGACLGCAVKGKPQDSYLHVCSEGPVFDTELLGWS